MFLKAGKPMPSKSLPKLYWIREEVVGNRQLCLMPKPNGFDKLEEEIRQLRQLGIDTLVCLLESPKLIESGLEKEAHFCLQNGIEYFHFPIPDYGTPSNEIDYLELIAGLDQQLKQGKAIAIHCFMGIGRSSLIAGGILMRRGLPWQTAFARITHHRGQQVPETKEQETWIQNIADRAFLI